MNSTESPTILYKYVTPGGAIAVLSSASVRFTPPLDLNDPFESRIPVARPVRRVTSPRRRSVFPKDQDVVLKAVNDVYGVTCFSEKPDSLLMWAHYAAAHSGVVIGFRTKHASFLGLGHLLPVQYRVRRPVLRSTISQESVLQLLSTKSREWAHEREWRIAARLKDCTRNGKLWLRSFDPECVAVLVLGARAKRSLTQCVLKWQAEHPSTRVLQARLDSLRFGLFLDESLEREPAVVVTEQRHVPVGYELPFASRIEMNDGTLIIRDVTAYIIPDAGSRRSLQARSRATGATITVYPKLPNKALEPTAPIRRKRRGSAPKR